MIPAHWRAHHRDEDGEVLGYLRPEGEGLHSPLTPFGHPLAGPLAEEGACAVLDSRGLTYLADPWLLSVPERQEPVRVRIVEVSPRRVTLLVDDFGYEGPEAGGRFELDVPVEGRLRPA